jgi:hypothetical protein
MTCTSRISRIIPTIFPYTLDSLPAEFSPFLSPSPAFTNALLNEDADRKATQIPSDFRTPLAPSSPRQETPLIQSPISPVGQHSWRGEPVESQATTRKYEWGTDEACHGSFQDHRITPSQDSVQKRDDYQGASSLTFSVRCDAQQDGWKQIGSSPTLTTSHGKMRRMMAATRLRKRHNRQDEQFSSGKNVDIRSHNNRYNHVVRTDALAPDPAPRTACNTFKPSTSQRQPWLKDNREIDWTGYFSSQPLPAVAGWSRLGATVHHVDGAWTTPVRLVSP